MRNNIRGGYLKLFIVIIISIIATIHPRERRRGSRITCPSVCLITGETDTPLIPAKKQRNCSHKTGHKEMGLTQPPKLVIVPGKRAFNYARLVAINVFISCYNYEKKGPLSETGKIVVNISPQVREQKRAHSPPQLTCEINVLRKFLEIPKKSSFNDAHEKPKFH